MYKYSLPRLLVGSLSLRGQWDFFSQNYCALTAYNFRDGNHHWSIATASTSTSDEIMWNQNDHFHILRHWYIQIPICATNANQIFQIGTVGTIGTHAKVITLLSIDHFFFLRRDICGIRFWPQPGCRLFPTASCLSNTKKHKNTNRRMQKICHKYKYTTKCKHKYTRTNTKLQSSCRLGPTASHLSKPTPVFFTTGCCA